MTTWRQPKHLSILLCSLRERGDSAALVGMRRDGKNSISGKQLARYSTRIAEGLREQGLDAGDRVAMIAEISPSLIATLLGTIASDCIAVPLDVQMQDETLKHVLKDCGAKIVLTTAKRADRVAELSGDRVEKIYVLEEGPYLDQQQVDEPESKQGYQSWRELLSQSAGAKDEDHVWLEGDHPEQKQKDNRSDWDDPAVLFYTSGTTGAPKGVPLTHRNLLTQITTIRNADLVEQGDRVLLPLPLHHVYPLVVGLFAPISLGLPVILPRSLTGPDILQGLQKGQASVLIGVPRLYQALYEAILSQAKHAVGRRGAGVVKGLLGASTWVRRQLGLGYGGAVFSPLHRRLGPNLRVLTSGGSPLDPELGWRLEGLGWKVAIGYGLTETSPLLTINPPGAGYLDSVGRAIPEVELRIDQDWRKQQSAEEQEDSQNGSVGPAREGNGSAGGKRSDRDEGEILARGPSVFSGYWNLPDKTKEAFTDDGWFRTGDLGYLDRRRRLHVTGRVSTLIITEQGEKVQPDEVESAYSAAAEIRELGVLQENGKLVGLVVPETSNIEGDDLELQVRDAVERINEGLPAFKQIRDLVLTHKHLPRTRIGKLRRRELEKLYSEAKQGESEPTVPIPRHEMSGEDQTLVEQPTASQIWDLLADQFSDQPLTPDSNMRRDLGVDSMHWLNLTMEVMQQTGIELDDSTLAEVKTVRDLLQTAERAAGGRGGSEAHQDFLADPESALSERERRRLRPLGSVGSLVADGGRGLNRKLVRWLFQLETEGLENMPASGPLVIVANHLSHLDPFVLSASLDRQRLERTYWAAWVGATETNPASRLFSRLAQTIPIDPTRGVLSSLAFGAAVLKQKGILVWFPEGRRSRTGELMPFQPGIGMLLERYEVPVIPAFIHGTYEAFPPGSRTPRRYPVHIRFGEPLNPKELANQGNGDDAKERIVDALQQAVRRMAEAEGAKIAEVLDERPKHKLVSRT